MAGPQKSRLRLQRREHLKSAKSRRKLRLERLESRLLLNGDWQNPFNDGDVNQDRIVTPADILVLINEINDPQISDSQGVLPERTDPSAPYLDPSGDGQLVPLDVLQVINQVNGDTTGPSIELGLQNDTGIIGDISDDQITSDPTVSGVAIDLGTGINRLEARLNDGPSIALTAEADGSFEFLPDLLLDGSADGVHTVTLSAADPRGNAAVATSFSFTLDTTPPAAPSAPDLVAADDSGLSSDDDITSTTLPAFSGTAEADVLVELRAGGATLGQLLTLTSSWSIAAQQELADGEYLISALAVDVAGNVSAPGPGLTVTVDTTSPAAPTGLSLSDATDSGAANNDELTNVLQAELEGIAEAGVEVELQQDGVALATATADPDFRFDVILREGRQAYSAVAFDTAGNRSDSTAVSIRVDRSNPQQIVAASTAGSVLDVSFDEAMAASVLDESVYTLQVSGGDQDGEVVAIDSVEAVTPSAVRLHTTSPLEDDTRYELTVATSVTDLAGNAPAAPLSAGFRIPAALRVDSISPGDGEERVGLERPVVIRFSDVVDGATIDPSSFKLFAAGSEVSGRRVVSSTQRFVTFYPDSPWPPQAEMSVFLDGSLVTSPAGDPLDADGDGSGGGTLAIDFRTLPITPIPDTDVFGFVFDAFNRNQDGTNIPLEGVTIRVDSLPGLTAVTDADGRFVLEDVPAPEFFVHIDGSTAAAPQGFVYPTVGKKFHSVAGQAVQLEMDGQPFDVFLPPMAMSDLQALSDQGSTDIAFGDDGLSNLQTLFPETPAEVWQRTSVRFATNAAVDPFGNPATEAAIIPVPSDRLPAPLPPQLNPDLVISIQAPGATQFDVPAPISFPNLEGLPPGDPVSLLSFRHDIGDWEVIGTGTVSPDGLMIESDPGVGIIAPGWHTVTPPLTGVGGGEEGPRTNFPQSENTEVEVKLFTVGSVDQLTFNFEPPRAGTELDRIVEISVEGNFEGIYEASGEDRLRSETLMLKPGDNRVTRQANLMSIGEITAANTGGLGFDADALLGAKIKVSESLVLADGSVEHQTKVILPYYYVDEWDNQIDGRIRFPDTVVTGSTAAVRPLTLELEGAPRPEFVVLGPQGIDFTATDTEFRHDPSTSGRFNSELRLRVTTEGQTVTSDQGVRLRAKGTEKQRVFVNTEELLRALVLGQEFRLSSTFIGAGNGPGETYTLNFGGSTTDPLPHNAKANLIQSALEALPNVAAGTVRVQRLRNASIDANAQRLEFEIEIKGQVSGGALEVSAQSNAGPGFSVEIQDRISGNEVNFLTAPATRQAIAEGIFNRVQQLFAPFSDGIEVVDDAGDGTNTITVRWFHTNFREGVLGHSRFFAGDDGIDNDAAIMSVVNQVHPLVQGAFQLDRAVNKSLSTNVAMFIDSYYELIDLNSFDDPVNLLINTLGKTVAHEAGHTLGGRHTHKVIGGALKEVSVNGVRGRTDIMLSGYDFEGNLAFQDGLTSEILRLALNLGWTVEQADLARRLYRSNLVTHGGFDSAPGIDEPDAIGNSSLQDATLFVLDSEGGDIYSSLELEPAIVDGEDGATSSTTILLQNGGAETLVLDEVSLPTNSPFSIVPITPGTELELGETIPLEITFDPQTAGDLSAELVLRTNDSTRPAVQLQVSGFGIQSEPTLHLEFPDANNNFGGVVVGTSSNAPYTIRAVNHGNEPLTLAASLVEGVADFGFVADSVTLDFGESVDLPLSFSPSDLGLRRGIVELTTNDPTQSSVRLGAVGTGILSSLPDSQAVDYGHDFAVLTDGVFTQRKVTNFKGGFRFDVPARREFELTVFDPISGLVATTNASAGTAGALRKFGSGLGFFASVAPDSDFDGLPDDIEKAIGTDLSVADTDDDGLDDFREIEAGLNPLDGLVFPTGVVASLGLPGTAESLRIVGQDDGSQLAYLATGSHGLAIVDVSNFSQPVLVGQLDLNGTATEVALDGPNLAVVATGGGGIQLVDVSNPTRPQLIRTLPIGGDQVEVAEGLAYVAGETALLIVDVSSGEVVNEFLNGGVIHDLALEDRFLYTLSENGVLQAHEIDVNTLVPRGSLPVGAAQDLFVGDQVAYLAVNAERGRFSTVDLSDPDNLALISGPDVMSPFVAPGEAIAPNGSGLGILVGDPNGQPTLSLMDVSDLSETFITLTQFPLPLPPSDLALAGGFAFVAGGNRLQAVNYLPFDNLGQPPEVTLSAGIVDADEVTTGIQVLEGSTIPLRVQVTDDVQVREVQLVVNGQVVQSDVSFPWQLSTIAPQLSNGSESLRIEARAIDTGGNEATSEPLVFDVIADVVPPTISFLSPGDGATGAPGIQLVQIEFSESMNPDSINENTVTLMDTTGAVITPNSIRFRRDDTRVQFTYPALGQGSYQVTLDTAAIFDRVGNALGTADLVNQFTLRIPDLLGLFPNKILRDGRQPTSVAVGDLNGDAFDDIAVANKVDSNTSKITLYLSDGGGDYAPPVDIDIARSAELIYLEHLNDDTHLDVVVGHRFPAQVSVLTGNGDGTFGAPQLHAVTAIQNEFIFGDLDGNLELDIVAVSTSGSTALLADGQGGFTSVDTSIRTQNAALGHFDADAHLDLVAEGNRLWQFYSGNGDGTFGTPTDTALNFSSEQVVSGDFNQDNKLDVVIAGTDNVPFTSAAVMFAGNGDGTFGQRVDLYTGSSNGTPKSLQAIDLNFDGIADLAIGSGSASDELVLLLSDTQGGFAATELKVPARQFVEHFDFGDLNQDGLLDLVSADETGERIHLQLGIGGGKVAASQLTTLGTGNEFSSLTNVHLANLTDDSAADLVAQFGSNIHVFTADGDGTFSGRRTLSANPFGSVEAFEIADVSGDGRLDLLALSQGRDNLVIFTNSEDGSFTRSEVSPGDAPSHMAVGDVTGDDHLDVMVFLPFSDSVVTMQNNGSGGFTRLPSSLSISDMFAMKLADVNHDQKNDLLLFEQTSDPDARVVVRLGNDDNTFGAPESFTVSRVQSILLELQLMDFDQDGNVDVLVNTAQASQSLLLGNGDGTFIRTADVEIDDRTVETVIADVDLDGKIDILGSADGFAEPLGGLLKLYRGNGDGTFDASVPFGIAQRFFPAYLAAGDADGDGDLDVVVGRMQNAHTLLGSGRTGLSGSPLHLGGPADASTEADPLTVADIASVYDTALTHWSASGLSEDSLRRLESVRFVIADLPETMLGLAQSNLIYLDQTAAGAGWFVDPTPHDDREFTYDADRIDRVDLLTVVLHEMGHLLGLDHSIDDDLMNALLLPHG